MDTCGCPAITQLWAACSVNLKGEHCSIYINLRSSALRRIMVLKGFRGCCLPASLSSHICIPRPVHDDQPLSGCDGPPCMLACRSSKQTNLLWMKGGYVSVSSEVLGMLCYLESCWAETTSVANWQDRAVVTMYMQQALHLAVDVSELLGLSICSLAASCFIRKPVLCICVQLLGAIPGLGRKMVFYLINGGPTVPFKQMFLQVLYLDHHKNILLGSTRTARYSQSKV